MVTKVFCSWQKALKNYSKFSTPAQFATFLEILDWKQGSTKSPSGHMGQVDFEVGQVTFHSHLPDGQVLRQVLRQDIPPPPSFSITKWPSPTQADKIRTKRSIPISYIILCISSRQRIIYYIIWDKMIYG